MNRFPLFGKKYQLKFASDVSGETHCLVHFPSFIRYEITYGDSNFLTYIYFVINTLTLLIYWGPVAP